MLIAHAQPSNKKKKKSARKSGKTKWKTSESSRMFVNMIRCTEKWREREWDCVRNTHAHTRFILWLFEIRTHSHTHADKQFNYRCWLSRDDIFNFIAGLLLSSVKPAWNDSQPDENCLRSVYAHIKVYFIHDINLCDVYSRIIWRFMKGTSLSHVICESITIINFYSLI